MSKQGDRRRAAKERAQIDEQIRHVHSAQHDLDATLAGTEAPADLNDIENVYGDIAAGVDAEAMTWQPPENAPIFNAPYVSGTGQAGPRQTLRDRLEAMRAAVIAEGAKHRNPSLLGMYPTDEAAAQQRAMTDEEHAAHLLGTPDDVDVGDIAAGGAGSSSSGGNIIPPPIIGRGIDDEDPRGPFWNRGNKAADLQAWWQDVSGAKSAAEGSASDMGILGAILGDQGGIGGMIGGAIGGAAGGTPGAIIGAKLGSLVEGVAAAPDSINDIRAFMPGNDSASSMPSISATDANVDPIVIFRQMNSALKQIVKNTANTPRGTDRM